MSLVESEQELERGDRAPAFELEGIDGQTHALDDFSEYDALLVVFTCNHCPYAQAKVDAMKRLHREYDELAVVGINPNDAEEYPEDGFEEMKAFAADRGIEYTYLRDGSQDVARAYGAVCTPDPFLFRNDGGTFRLAYHGRFDDSLNPEGSTRSSELSKSSSSALNPDEEPSEFYMDEAVESVLAGEDVDLEFLPSQGCSIKWKD